MRRAGSCFLLLAIILLAGCPSLFDKPSEELMFVAIAAGSDHAIAVDSNGNVWTWGKTTTGRLATGPPALGIVRTH